VSAIAKQSEKGCAGRVDEAELSPFGGTATHSLYGTNAAQPGLGYERHRLELSRGQPHREDPQMARAREEVLAGPGAEARHAERDLA